jgi:16S rRNA (guanine527-N7)-methyltransferase
VLTAESIGELIQPYVQPAALTDLEVLPDWAHVCDQLSIYLELILKWNARINLTAIRSPEEIVRRHFGESLFAGGRLGVCQTLLDFGSGAGLPGVPIQLMRPEIAVTLAESRSRKAAFLHEVVRTLGLRTEVWAGRVEAMPAERRFDVAAMRAVEDMEAAVVEAGRRAKERVLVLGTGGFPVLAGVEGFRVGGPEAMPGSDDSVLWTGRRR